MLGVINLFCANCLGVVVLARILVVIIYVVIF